MSSGSRIRGRETGKYFMSSSGTNVSRIESSFSVFDEEGDDVKFVLTLGSGRVHL